MLTTSNRKDIKVIWTRTWNLIGFVQLTLVAHKDAAWKVANQSSQSFSVWEGQPQRVQELEVYSLPSELFLASSRNAVMLKTAARETTSKWERFQVNFIFGGAGYGIKET